MSYYQLPNGERGSRKRIQITHLLMVLSETAQAVIDYCNGDCFSQGHLTFLNLVAGFLFSCVSVIATSPLSRAVILTTERGQSSSRPIRRDAA